MDTNDILSIKRGYLKEKFKIFHIKDKKSIEFESHYHDFNKIIVFISGDVTYLIEGKAYNLKPWDILFISSKEVHKPLISPEETYERYIIWVNDKFLDEHCSSECNLFDCFNIALSSQFNLLRLNTIKMEKVKSILYQIENDCINNKFGSTVLKNALFIQLIVFLNRYFSECDKSLSNKDIEYDESIQQILLYINERLCEELFIEDIASKFYMSKYHLMHKFKLSTGYTIHNYILQKRLALANTLIVKGESAVNVCIKCGFGDYANFVRAFKKEYGLAPKKYYKAIQQLEHYRENAD